MRGVDRELADLFETLAQPLHHAVESADQLVEFIPGSVFREAHIQMAAAHRSRGCGEFFDGHQRAAGDQPAKEPDNHQHRRQGEKIGVHEPLQNHEQTTDRHADGEIELLAFVVGPAHEHHVSLALSAVLDLEDGAGRGQSLIVVDEVVVRELVKPRR